VFTQSRHFYDTSILDEQQSNSKQRNKIRARLANNAKSLAISINTQIIALGKEDRWIDILNLYQKEKQNFNAVNYSTVMSQLARIRQMPKDDPLFESFLDDLSAKLYECGINWLGDVRHLLTTVHAFMKMGLQPNRNSSVNQIMTFVAEAETAEWLVKNGTPQSIANCVWACGKLGIEAPKLFELLDERAEWLMNNGIPQSIANSVWACGKLGIQAPKLFRVLDERAEWLLENGTSQNIANCAWACGKLGIKAPKLFKLLGRHAKWLAGNGTQQEIANCVWACKKLGIKAPKLFLHARRTSGVVDEA
jgi:hypothetical protein